MVNTCLAGQALLHSFQIANCSPLHCLVHHHLAHQGRHVCDAPPNGLVTVISVSCRFQVINCGYCSMDRPQESYHHVSRQSGSSFARMRSSAALLSSAGVITTWPHQYNHACVPKLYHPASHALSELTHFDSGTALGPTEPMSPLFSPIRLLVTAVRSAAALL